jgi:hypothetical protein
VVLQTDGDAVDGSATTYRCTPLDLITLCCIFLGEVLRLVSYCYTFLSYRYQKGGYIRCVCRNPESPSLVSQFEITPHLCRYWEARLLSRSFPSLFLVSRSNYPKHNQSLYCNRHSTRTSLPPNKPTNVNDLGPRIVNRFQGPVKLLVDDSVIFASGSASADDRLPYD